MVQQVLTAILKAFLEILHQLIELRESQQETHTILKRQEHKMAQLLDAVVELEADDVAVVAALNALAQTINDLKVTQTDPALVARLETIHQDFVNAVGAATTPPTP